MDFAGMKRRELQALCKRHGLPAGGTNAALVARLDAAALSGAAGAEEEGDVVGAAAPARKGCLKRSAGDAAEAKKVTFAVEESRGRRSKCAEAGADAAPDSGIPAEPGASAPVRRSRRNSLTAAEAEEVQALATVVGSKRKPKSQEVSEDVAVGAQVVAPSGVVTRRSSLSGTAVLPPPAVEKKRGRGKAADGEDKLVADAQDSSAAAASPAVAESKRSRRKGENCEPDVSKSAKVEASTRTTRSRSVEDAVMPPTVVESKRRRKTGDAQPDAELPTVPEVPRNDAPVTRSLRSRAVQVSNNVVEETHTSQQLENKLKPSRPATRRHQQVASSVEEEGQEQVPAPSKALPLKRSGRNNSETSNANSESNKLSSTLVEAKDSKTAHPLTRNNAKAEDVEKQPIVKEPVRRLTRRSVVSAMLDNEKNIFEEKNSEAHVRGTMRKSIVPVKDIKGFAEESQNAKGEDAATQPAVKEPVRRSTRKSVVSVMHEKEKDLIAEKNLGTHVRRSKRKSVVPVEDMKGVDEDIQNSKGADVQKQLVVKQPVRRSSRKSVLPDTLESESGCLVAETNAEAHVRGSTRKSALPNVLNKKNPDHTKIARNENFESGECEDEKQQKVKEPVRRSRRSVATVMLEEENKGRNEGKPTTIPLRRTTRKSVALNVVEIEKERTDHTEEVGREQARVGARQLKVTDQPTDGAVAGVASGNESHVEVAVQNSQGLQQSAGKSSDHNLSDYNERHPGSDKCVSSERVGEEGLKLEQRRSSMEISSSANDSWNAEDFSGPKFREQQSAKTPSEKEYTETNYDKPLRAQQASNTSTSKGRSSKRRRTTVPEEIMSAEEETDDMVIREATKDTHKVSNEYSKECSSRIQDICQVDSIREEISSPLLGTVTLPDEEIFSAQSIHRVIPGSESGDAAKESSDKSKQPQEHSDIQADDVHLSETRNGEVVQLSSIAELLPHNCFVSEDKTLMGEASGSSLPMSDSNPEIFCDVISEQSIEAADLGRCPSNGGKENPVLTNLHSDGAGADRILPVLNDAKGCSSDGRHSSLGLEFLFTEECKESCSRIVENTAVEVDGANKSSASVSPGFYVASDCGLEDEDGQSTGFDSDKKLAEEEVAEEKSHDGHVAAKTDLNTKLNVEHTGLDMELDCSSAEKNVRPVADNPDEEATIQVLQSYTQEGDSEKPSQFSATPECKNECGLPEETVLHSKENKGRLSIAEKSPFGLQFLFSTENREKSVEYGALASATVHMENVFGELKDCHVKCTLEKTHASEPFSHHDTDEGSHSVSKNDVSMCTSQQDNGTEDCGLEDEDGQSTGFDSDKKLAEEEVAEEKSHDGHVAAKTDLNTKLNVEHTGLDMELDCSSAEKNVRPVADNPDEEEATIQVLQSYTQEGDSEKPSQFSATPECKNECGLPEETVLHSKENKGRLSIAEKSPFGLQFLFSTENREKSVEYGALASATVHMENVFGELKDCHVKCTLEKTHASEPFSHHDTDEGSHLVSKNDVSMCTSQQDNGTEGLSKASLEEEWVSSGFSSDANNIKDVTNSEEVACKGEGSKKPVHSDDRKASSEKTDVNGPADNDNAHSVTDDVLSSALHAPANDNYACLDSNTELLQQGHKDRCSDDTEERFTSKPWANDIIDDAIAKYSGNGVSLLPAQERSHLQDGQLNTKLEVTKVLESGLNFSKDISGNLDNGSAVGSIGERTPSGSGLSKDSSIEYNLRQEVLDDSSAETFLDGSTTCGGKTVSTVDIIENPSFSLATPCYKHESALSEEAVRTMKKYAGTCSSNPRELLMDLQSLFSKENIEESDSQDGLAFTESPGGESIDGKQQVEVHLGSNMSQLESSDPLDGPIGCSNTEVLHQGLGGCSEDREEQVASGPCTNDIAEAAAARYVESGVVLLPSEERSNLKDGQLKPEKESGLNCSKGVTNISGSGSAVDIVGQRTPSGSGLPEDYCTDYNLQQEFLHGCSVEPSLQGSAVSLKKIVSGVAVPDTIENPSFSLATPNYKHEDGGALSEEEVCKMKNYTGTCSADPRHLLMELQSLFSDGSIEKFDPHDDLGLQSAERGRNEPVVCHIEKPVDTLVCSEPDTNQGLCQDLSRAEEKESCISISVQHYESGGFLRSSHMKDWAVSAQTDLSDDAHLIERNNAVEEVLCEEKEKRESMPTSDSEILHEKSCSNKHGICQSHGQKHIVEINSKQSSGDSEIMHQDHKEENNKSNEDKIIANILENSMSEETPVKGIESSVMLPSVDAGLQIPDEKLKTKLGDEGEEHSFSCGQDTIEPFCTGSAQKDMFPLTKDKDYHVDSCRKQDVPDVLSLIQSPEESANCIDESATGSGPCETSGQQCLNEVSRASSLDKDTHEDPPSDLSPPVFKNHHSVLGSVGICQSSRRRGIDDELSAMLQSFKVSSTVKGSYIAMSAPRPKPGDNLGQSAIALLQNRENAPAGKAERPAKPNSDRSVAKGSSRRALQPISGRPTDG